MAADLKSARRIATEEAFSIPEVAAALRGVARAPGNSLDLILVKRIYDAPKDDHPQMAALLPRLVDLEQERLRDMDQNGVAMHLLSLTAPGVQMFDADTATELAALANDRLAAVVQKHPHALRRPRSVRAALAQARCEGNGAGHQNFEAERLYRELAHQ